MPHRLPAPGCRSSDRNSARVSFWRKHPTMALVTVDEFCFSIPRIIMHKVARLDYHAHALRRNRFLNGVGNLPRQPLLHLQAARKYFNQPRNLAQPDDLPLGNIGHMHTSEKTEACDARTTKTSRCP